MNRELDVLTLLLLDPCLTADEAAREAAARQQLAMVTEVRGEVRRRRERRPQVATAPAEDHPAVEF